MGEPYITKEIDLVVHESGWLDLPGNRRISRLPIWDRDIDGPARRGVGPLNEWTKTRSLRLPTLQEYYELHARALHIEPYTLPTLAMIQASGIPRPYYLANGADSPGLAKYRADNMRTLEWCKLHDHEVRTLLLIAGWNGEPVANWGKHQTADGTIVGWWYGKGGMIQSPSSFHKGVPTYTDYATLQHVVEDSAERTTRPEPIDTDPAPVPALVELGDSRRDVVQRVQRIVGVTADGVFGNMTKAKVRTWQEAHGLVPDGKFGKKSWRAAGVIVNETVASTDPRAPACLAALRDATSRWPTRNRASDGIMGDTAHQFKPGPDGKLGTADDVPNNSDHNVGNAVDITHDPVSGCHGSYIAELAIQDPRVTYVIWNRKIYNRTRAAEGWRNYTGANGHTHHCHISVRADVRNDSSTWAWAA